MADPKRPTILALRTTGPDGRAYHDAARRTGFVWPVGPDAVGQRVEAPDWSPAERCGGGLHGLSWGEGGAGHLSTDPDAVWQVVEVDASEVVDLGDKIKFRACIIRYSGSRAGASEFLWQRAPAGTRLARAALTGGNDSTLTGGDGSTLTGGDRCTLTGGHQSTLTGGYYSTLTGGNWSTLTGGYYSTLTGGNWSTLTGGNRCTLTGGDDSTLTGGNRCTLTGGDRCTLTGGARCTLTGGYYSALSWRLWDGHRYRIHTVYPGEGGIKIGTAYRAIWRDGAAVVEEVERG